MRRRRFASFITLLLVALALGIGQRAEARSKPTERLRQAGKTALVYRGPALDLALSYRYAKANLGKRWLFLDVAMTSPDGSVEVARNHVAVVTPDGQIVPLASQRQFADAYSTLIPSIAGANVAAEPLGYLTPHRPRWLGLFSAPGRTVVFPSVWVDEWHTIYGRLYFDLPDKVVPGQYALLITLKQGEVRVPFQL